MAFSQIETLSGRRGRETIDFSVPLIAPLDSQSIPGIEASEGFVITTSINNEIFKQNSDILRRIEILDDTSSHWLKANLKSWRRDAGFWENQIIKRSEEVEEGMEKMELSPEVKDKINNALDNLCKKVGKENIRVSVYSPIVDGSDGQFIYADESKISLGQQREDEVVKVVKECFISQFSPEAIKYRNEKRLKLAQESLLEDKSQTIARALAKSKNFSHIESKLVIVVRG